MNTRVYIYTIKQHILKRESMHKKYNLRDKYLWLSVFLKSESDIISTAYKHYIWSSITQSNKRLNFTGKMSQSHNALHYTSRMRRTDKHSQNVKMIMIMKRHWSITTSDISHKNDNLVIIYTPLMFE